MEYLNETSSKIKAIACIFIIAYYIEYTFWRIGKKKKNKCSFLSYREINVVNVFQEHCCQSRHHCVGVELP